MKPSTLVNAAAFAAIASAAPATDVEATTNIEVRDGALEHRQGSGFCEWRVPNHLYMSWNIEIDNDQDGGLCGGFWDNINGDSGCQSATGRKCEVEGTKKKIFFRTTGFCNKSDIEWIISAATDPTVELDCVRRD